MAKLLMESPSNVVLRPSHWSIPRNELVAGLPGATGQLRALPVPPDKEVDDQVAKIIRSVLRAQGGEFNPNWIVNNWLVLPPHEETVHARLNKLAMTKQLKQFVASNDDFMLQWPHDGTGWIITWAPDDNDWCYHNNPCDWCLGGEDLEWEPPDNGPTWLTLCGSKLHRYDNGPYERMVSRRLCHRKP